MIIAVFRFHCFLRLDITTTKVNRYRGLYEFSGRNKDNLTITTNFIVDYNPANQSYVLVNPCTPAKVKYQLDHRPLYVFIGFVVFIAVFFFIRYRFFYFVGI